MKSLIAMVAIFLGGGISAQAQPVILNASTDVIPSDVICLQGSDFGSSPTVWCSSNHGTATQLSVFNTGIGVVQAQLPNATIALYSVYVKNGTIASTPVYLNQAKPMHFDTPEIVHDGTFRIFGRNLGFNSQAAVVFVAGSTTLPASVLSYSENTLTVKAPSGVVAGTVYTVKVWNGLGSSTTDYISCPMTMTGRASGSDAFNLGVPWAGSYVSGGTTTYDVTSDTRLGSLHAQGNGSNNDQPAIQNAIYAVSAAGGGTVYLPAGTYKLLLPTTFNSRPAGTLLNMQNNVVIKGAGQGLTKLIYGYETNPVGAPYTYFAGFFGTISNCGICDLTVQNLNTNGDWNVAGSIATSSPSGSAECVRGFLARVTYDLLTSQFMFFEGDRMVVENCTLGAQSTVSYMGGSTNFRYFSNTVTQTSGTSANFDSSSSGVVENNLFVLNANNGQTDSSTVRHGVNLNFAQNVAVVNNTFNVTNGVPGANNDGEAILSEGGGPIRPGEEFGHVTAAGTNTLTVSNSAAFIPGTVVCIINGTGRGQWRTIDLRTGTQLTLNDVWSVMPDSTSNYAVFQWGLKNVTISGNNLTGWPGAAIVSYMSSTTDTEISGNTISGMDGIWLQPDQCNTNTVSSPNGHFNPVWNTQVDSNTLSSRGTHGTYVNLTADLQYSSDNTLYGTMALNCEVRHNTIQGSEIKGSQTQFMPNVFYNYVPSSEGFVNYLRVETTTVNDQNIPALLGTVFMWNTVNDCAERGFLINGGAYQTFICATNTWNDAALITDSATYAACPGHTSIGTVNIANGWAAPTVYEFEAGTLTKGNINSPLHITTNVAQASQHSGTGGMNYTGDAVTINNVSGDGGTHKLTFRYCCPALGTSDVYLNGTQIATITWPQTQDWNTYADVSLSVTLPSGNNAIMVRRDAANNSVDLDKFVVN